MEKVLIARMGLEGGGVTVFGTKSECGWLFWQEGTSMALDETDDEVWRSWSSQPVNRLDLALPRDWPLFGPFEIHTEFLESFRDAYEKARAALPEAQLRYQDEHRHRRWLEVLGVPG